MKEIGDNTLNSTLTRSHYFVSLMGLLLFIWSLVLAWFHFYLEVHFSAPHIVALLALVFATLALFILPSKPIFRLKPRALSNDTFWFLLLCWVFILNSALLYFTGGKINPLIHILLMPLVFGMLLLPAFYFLSLAIIAIGCYSLLNFYYVPIMSLKVQSLQAFFSWHLHGSTLVFMVLVLILSVVIWPLKTRLEIQNVLLEKKRNKALQEEYFLATASLAAASVHKLSTPLNSLQLLNGLMANEVKSEQGKEYLQMAGEQINVCVDVLHSLRERAENANEKRIEPLSLEKFVANLREEFALIQPASELKTSTVPTDEKLWVDNTFKLALLNLCDNAARYSPEYIHLNAYLDDSQWHFIVEDHGGGVSDKDLQFLGSGLYEESHGMGMGLFLTRMIIERFGGSLRFDNMEADNQRGLKVTVSLPFERNLATERLE